MSTLEERLNALKIGEEPPPNEGEAPQPFITDQSRPVTPSGAMANVEERQVAAAGGREQSSEWADMRQFGQFPEPDFATRQRMGFADTATFGAWRYAAAKVHQLRDRMAGLEPLPYGEQLEQTREHYDENAGLLGAVAGGVAMPVAGVAMAARGAGRGAQAITKIVAGQSRLTNTPARRIATVTALGTAAGGLTGLNQSGTLQGAGTEAAMGAVFGAAGQGIGETIEAIASTEWARRYIRGGAKESVHEAFQDALVRRFGRDAFEALDEGGYLNIDNALARARPGETVYDAFPREVQNEINQLVELGQRPGNTDVYYAMGAVYEAAANRASMMDDRVMQSVQDAVGTPTLRNRAELEQYSARGRQEIGGQLQEVYSRAAGVRFDPQVVEELINAELARGTLENSGPAIDVARSVRNLLRDVPDEGLTPQAYSAFLQDLDDVIYGANAAGSGYRDGGVQVSSRMMREFLQPLRQGLRQYAYDEIEGLAPLMGQYANEARVNLAYQAGQRALGAAGVRDDAFELFRGTTDRTPMEVEFFAEGVKAELTRQLAGKTPRQIEAFVRSNPERMRQVEVILDAAGEGDGAVSQQLMEAVATYQTDLRIAEFAEMAPPAAVNLSERGSELGQILGDTLMAGAGLATNVLSSSLGAGAARRLLGRGDQASSASYATSRGEAAAELATMPPREGLEAVRNTMQTSQPGLAPSVGGILGYGTATTDTAGQQPDTAFSF